MIQKTYDLTAFYQNELKRLKEDQLRKWNEIISKLGMLQNQDSDDRLPQAQKFLEELQKLQKQSEDNKKMLMENIELQNLIKTQSLISDDKSLIQDLNQIMKNSPNNIFGMFAGTFATNSMMTGFNIPTANQTPIDSFKNHIIENTSATKLDKDVNSPVNHDDHRKKNIFHMFRRKPNLEIDVDLANEEQSESKDEQSEIKDDQSESKNDTKSNEKFNKTESAPNVSYSIANVDIHNLRYALPSEALLREESFRTLNPQSLYYQF